MNAELPNIYRLSRGGGSNKALWLAVFVLTACLYASTAQRGISWQDSGLYQWRALQGDFEGELGLALAHPLYIAAGHGLALVCGQKLPLLLNVFSGLGMAVALANLSIIASQLTGRRWIGAAIAAMLAVAHTPWWLATVAEVYSWSLAGFTLEVWLLIKLIRVPRWQVLAGLGLVAGLGWSIHNFALLGLPVYAGVAIWLCSKRRLAWWSLLLALGAYVLGAWPYLMMIAQYAARTSDIAGAMHSALFGQYAAQVAGQGQWQYLKVNLALMSLNFVNFLLPLAIIGWWWMRRRLGGPTTLALIALTIIHVLFVLRYPVPDQFTFVLPSLVMIAIAAAVGLGVLSERRGMLRKVTIAMVMLSIAMPPIMFSLLPRFAVEEGFAQVRRPFRNEARYWITPWKHNERSAELFVRSAFAVAMRGSCILADDTAEFPLRVAKALYAQMDADIAINCDVNVTLKERQVYVAGEVRWLQNLPEIQLAEAFPLKRVVWINPEASSTSSRPAD